MFCLTSLFPELALLLLSVNEMTHSLGWECVVSGGKKSNWGECIQFSEHEMGVVRIPPTPLNLAQWLSSR